MVDRKKLAEYLELRKKDLFSDANTWRKSGEPYANDADMQEIGYTLAMVEVLSWLRNNDQ